jgi:hypothetical protein
MESVEYSNLFLQESCVELPLTQDLGKDGTWSLEDIDFAGGVGGLTECDGFFGGCAGMDGFVLEGCFEWVFGDDGFSWSGSLGRALDLVLLVRSVTCLKHGWTNKVRINDFFVYSQNGSRDMK